MKTKNGKAKCGLSIDLLARMAEVLKLLAHPHRLKIIEILDVNGGAPVFAIAEQLDLPQAATSQHLNQMKRVGLITADRRGKEVWYTVADPRALTILSWTRKNGGKS